MLYFPLCYRKKKDFLCVVKTIQTIANCELETHLQWPQNPRLNVLFSRRAGRAFVDDAWWEAATSCSHTLVFQQLAGAKRSRRPLAPIHPPSMPLATSHRPLHPERVRRRLGRRATKTDWHCTRRQTHTRTHTLTTSYNPAGVCFFFPSTFNLPLGLPCLLQQSFRIFEKRNKQTLFFIVHVLIQTNQICFAAGDLYQYNTLAASVRR